MRGRIVSSIIALSVATAAQAAPNLIANGGFETNGGVGQIGAITTLADWTVSTLVNGAPYPYVFVADASADDTGFPIHTSPPSMKLWGPNSGVNNGFVASPSGGAFLAASGDYGRAGIKQTISGLTVGHIYRLTFEQALAQSTDYSEAILGSWNVMFGSSFGDGGSFFNANRGFSGWSSATVDFTADATTQELRFVASGTLDALPLMLLDNVTLTDTTPTPPPSAVPEPATWAMMFGGFAFAGAALRRRRAAVRFA